jgi:hypothetical protein
VTSPGGGRWHSATAMLAAVDRPSGSAGLAAPVRWPQRPGAAAPRVGSDSHLCQFDDPGHYFPGLIDFLTSLG